MKSPQIPQLSTCKIEMYEALDPNGVQDGYILVYDNEETGTHEERWVPTEADALFMFSQMNDILLGLGLKKEFVN